jgi:copper amine oxidase-like protein
MKRFLSIFAIMALIVSMFSGVGFAAPVANDAFTLSIDDTDEIFGQGVAKDIVVSVNNDSGDLEGYKIRVYDKDNNAVSSISEVELKDTATSSPKLIKATIPGAQVKTLPIGTYAIKISACTDSATVDNTGATDDQTIDLDGAESGTDTATVAIVTFEVRNEGYIKLDSNCESIKYIDGPGSVAISGKIFNSASKASYRITKDVYIYEDTNNDGILNAGEIDSKNQIQKQPANDGEFRILVAPSNLGIGRFFVCGNTDPDIYFDEDNYDTFVVVNEIELENELSFEFPVTGQVSFSGAYTNEDGDKDNVPLVLGYVKDGIMTKEISGTAFNDGKAFTFLFNAYDEAEKTESMYKTGKIGLFLEVKADTTSDPNIAKTLVLVKEGEIKAGNLAVEADIDTTARALGAQEIVFDFDLDKDKIIDESTGFMKKDYMLRMHIVAPNDSKVDLDGTKTYYDGSFKDGALTENDTVITLVAKNTKKMTDPAKQKVKVLLDVDQWYGEYDLVVELFDNTSGVENIVQTKTLKLKVKNPATYTVIGWGLKEHNVGKVTVEFPNNTGGLDTDKPTFTTTTADQQLKITKYNSTANKYPKFFEVTADGAGVDKKTFKNFGTSPVKDDMAEILTTETGTLKLSVKAYFKDTDKSPSYTFTKEVKITGWNVEFSPKEVTVESEEDLVFTIVNHDGIAINNAMIYIDLNKDENPDSNELVIDSSKVNVVGGTYNYDYSKADNVFTDDVNDYDIIITDIGGNKKVTLTDAFVVKGQEVFSVTSDLETLVNGVEDVVYISVLNEDNDIVYPSFKQYNYKADGTLIDSVEITPSSRKDIDGVSGNEACKFTITPDAEVAKMIIRATTDGGKKMGEVSIEVQKPQMVMTGAQTLTEDLYTNVEFQLVDPRDNSVLEEAVQVDSITYGALEVADPEDHDTTISLLNDLDSNDEFVYNYHLFAQLTDDEWEQAAKDDKAVEVKFTMGSVVLDPVPVATALFTATPESLIIGSGANITLTYTDAEGNALKERKIKLTGDEIGETDEDGKLVYVASSSSSVALSFTAETDDSNAPVSLKVKSIPDINGPVVEHKVVGNTAIITVSDESLIYTFYVNGKKVESLFPSKQQVYTVEGLQVGMNKVSVVAADKFFNPTMLELEIEVVAPQVEKVEFTLNNAIGDLGTPVKIGTTSMVPARLVEELGVSFAWDAEAQTVEYTYGETTVKLTVDSKTGIVNGENVPLSEAPYLNDKGRLMVPVRMVGQSLGFDVKWSSDDAPIIISKIVK